MSDVLRDHLQHLKVCKQQLEKTMDKMALLEGLGAGRVLRCASRHWPGREDVWRHVGGPGLGDSFRQAFDQWMDCHEEYEFMITQDIDVWEEVRMDRFRRALEDSKGWKI